MANPFNAVRVLAFAAALLSIPVVVDMSTPGQGSVLRFDSACAAEECEKDDQFACLLGDLPLVGYRVQPRVTARSGGRSRTREEGRACHTR